MKWNAHSAHSRETESLGNCHSRNNHKRTEERGISWVFNQADFQSWGSSRLLQCCVQPEVRAGTPGGTALVGSLEFSTRVAYSPSLALTLASGCAPVQLASDYRFRLQQSEFTTCLLFQTPWF
ncbi:hypothetical protein R1flu_021643 [Riccia fluitans]|uniref:Uncharacterized protein n=1 Tax=Riccia fluitans TaxID=41844 RepID=A0ABD1ZQC5_9MARC